jgi:exonuclease SbcD
LRFLHTSDLHLGRSFQGIPLEEDHRAILDQILLALDEHKPDALLIPGDIFDRTIPPDSAVRQFSSFVKEVKSRDIAVVFIAGNHDSADKIGSFGVLADGNVLVRGRPLREELPLILEDEHGKVAISALPFSYEYAAQACFDDPDIKTPADVLQAQVNAARSFVPEGARWVILAHTFVVGGRSSDSERNLGRIVGGLETVPASVFEGAHYVALGHLHQPQTVGADHIQYCGSPLAFGFDESASTKSMTLVELAPTGDVETQRLPFKPIRSIRTLRGKFADLKASAKPSNDFIQIILTDNEPILDPMKRIREFYPNACLLIYEREDGDGKRKEIEHAERLVLSPVSLIRAFLNDVRTNEISDNEELLITDTVAICTTDIETGV